MVFRPNLEAQSPSSPTSISSPSLALHLPASIVERLALNSAGGKMTSSQQRAAEANVPALHKEHAKRIIVPTIVICILCVVVLVLALARELDVAKSTKSYVEQEVAEMTSMTTQQKLDAASSQIRGAIKVFSSQTQSLFDFFLENKTRRIHQDFCNIGFTLMSDELISASSTLIPTPAQLLYNVVTALTSRITWQIDFSRASTVRRSDGTEDLWIGLCILETPSTVSVCDFTSSTSPACVPSSYTSRKLPALFGFVRKSSSTVDSLVAFVTDNAKTTFYSSDRSFSASNFEWDSNIQSSSSTASFSSEIDYLISLYSVSPASRLFFTLKPSVSPLLPMMVHSVNVSSSSSSSTAQKFRTVSAFTASILFDKIYSTLSRRLQFLDTGSISLSNFASVKTNQLRLSFLTDANTSAYTVSTSETLLKQTFSSVSTTKITQEASETQTKTALNALVSGGGGNSSSFINMTTSSSLLFVTAIQDCSIKSSLIPMLCNISLDINTAFTLDALSTVIESKIYNRIVGAQAFQIVLTLIIVILMIGFTYFLVKNARLNARMFNDALKLTARNIAAAGLLETTQLTFYEDPEELERQKQEELEEEELEARRLQQINNNNNNNVDSSNQHHPNGFGEAMTRNELSNSDGVKFINDGEANDAFFLTSGNPIINNQNQQQQQQNSNNNNAFGSLSNHPLPMMKTSQMVNGSPSSTPGSSWTAHPIFGSGGAAAVSAGSPLQHHHHHHQLNQHQSNSLSAALNNNTHNLSTGSSNNPLFGFQGASSTGTLMREQQQNQKQQQTEERDPAHHLRKATAVPNVTVFSDIEEIVELQIKLNELCTAVVESRTVIPRAAFDLFLAQYGIEQQHEQLIEEGKSKGGFRSRNNDEEQKIVDENNNNTSSGASPVNSSFGNQNQAQQQQNRQQNQNHHNNNNNNTPQEQQDGITQINVLDATTGSVNLNDTTHSNNNPLPQIRVLGGDESMSSHPNASLTDYPILTGANQSLTDVLNGTPPTKQLLTTTHHSTTHNKDRENILNGSPTTEFLNVNNNNNASSSHNNNNKDNNNSRAPSAFDFNPMSAAQLSNSALAAQLASCPLQRRKAVVLCATLGGIINQLCEDENLHDARALSQLFLNVVTKWINDHGGTVHKMAADHVVAVWGAVLRVPDAELKACLCAQDINETLHNMRVKTRYEFDWSCNVISGTVTSGSCGTVSEKTPVIHGPCMALSEDLPSLMAALGIKVAVTEQVKEKVVNSGQYNHKVIWHGFPVDQVQLLDPDDGDITDEVKIYELRPGYARDYLKPCESALFSHLMVNDPEPAVTLLTEVLENDETSYVASMDEQVMRLYKLSLWSQAHGIAYQRPIPVWQRNLAELPSQDGSGAFSDHHHHHSNTNSGVHQNNQDPFSAFGLQQQQQSQIDQNNSDNAQTIISVHDTSHNSEEDDGIFSGRPPPPLITSTQEGNNTTPAFGGGRAGGIQFLGQSFMEQSLSRANLQQQQNHSGDNTTTSSSNQHLSVSRRYDRTVRRRSTHVDDVLRMQLLAFSMNAGANGPSGVGSVLARPTSSLGGSGNNMKIPSRGPSRLSRAATPIGNNNNIISNMNASGSGNMNNNNNSSANNLAPPQPAFLGGPLSGFSTRSNSSLGGGGTQQHLQSPFFGGSGVNGEAPSRSGSSLGVRPLDSSNNANNQLLVPNRSPRRRSVNFTPDIVLQEENQQKLIAAQLQLQQQQQIKSNTSSPRMTPIPPSLTIMTSSSGAPSRRESPQNSIHIRSHSQVLAAFGTQPQQQHNSPNSTPPNTTTTNNQTGGSPPRMKVSPPVSGNFGSWQQQQANFANRDRFGNNSNLTINSLASERNSGIWPVMQSNNNSNQSDQLPPEQTQPIIQILGPNEQQQQQQNQQQQSSSPIRPLDAAQLATQGTFSSSASGNTTNQNSVSQFNNSDRQVIQTQQQQYSPNNSSQHLNSTQLDFKKEVDENNKNNSSASPDRPPNTMMNLPPPQLAVSTPNGQQTDLSPSPRRNNNNNTYLSPSPVKADQNNTTTSVSPSQQSQHNTQSSTNKTFTIKDRKGLTFRVSDHCLGKGAFGEVYLGLTETGIPVAVKIVSVPGVDQAAAQAAAAANNNNNSKSPSVGDARSPSTTGATEGKKPLNAVALRRAKRKGLPVAKSDDVRKDIEQVLTEVSVLSKLRHENIVGYLSSAVIRQIDKEAMFKEAKELHGITDDKDDAAIKAVVPIKYRTRLALVMEFIPGGALSSLLGKLTTPLNEQTAVHYLRDILRGLKFLHDSDFVHRDLKPQNCLLLQDGSVKLTDFGTSVNLGKLSGETDMMGTPQYMSPEACRGETPTRASDVWAFGIVMAELLTGSVPWPVEPGVPYSPIRFIYQIGHVETMIPKLDVNVKVPRAAEKIIMLCCQRDQSKRPTVQEILDMDYFRRMDAQLSKGGDQQQQQQDSNDNINAAGTSGSSLSAQGRLGSMLSNTNLSDMTGGGPPPTPNRIGTAQGGSRSPHSGINNNSNHNSSGTNMNNKPPHHHHHHSMMMRSPSNQNTNNNSNTTAPTPLGMAAGGGIGGSSMRLLLLSPNSANAPANNGSFGGINNIVTNNNNNVGNRSPLRTASLGQPNAVPIPLKMPLAATPRTTTDSTAAFVAMNNNNNNNPLQQQQQNSVLTRHQLGSFDNNMIRRTSSHFLSSAGQITPTNSDRTNNTNNKGGGGIGSDNDHECHTGEIQPLEVLPPHFDSLHNRRTTSVTANNFVAFQDDVGTSSASHTPLSGTRQQEMGSDKGKKPLFELYVDESSDPGSPK